MLEASLESQFPSIIEKEDEERKEDMNYAKNFKNEAVVGDYYFVSEEAA